MAHQPYNIFAPNFHQVDPTHLPDQILVSIARILVSKAAAIAEARTHKGGWEGWLQVELAMGLKPQLGTHYTIKREQPIFLDHSQRVDILATPTPADSSHYLGVELKVESAYQTGSKGVLPARYSEDIRKCNAGPATSFRKGKGISVYALGITSLASDLQNYNQVAKENRGDFYWTQLAPSLYMISWKAEWAEAR